MKNSHIFWNIMIIVVEIIIGLIMFGFEPEIFEYLTVVWGALHSLFLLADISDRRNFDKDSFFPAFLFVSILGVILLIAVGIIFLIFKIGESNFNPFRNKVNPITRFNNWLDRKK